MSNYNSMRAPYREDLVVLLLRQGTPGLLVLHLEQRLYEELLHVAPLVEDDLGQLLDLQQLRRLPVHALLQVLDQIPRLHDLRFVFVPHSIEFVLLAVNLLSIASPQHYLLDEKLQLRQLVLELLIALRLIQDPLKAV